jgi:hypothetical protein
MIGIEPVVNLKKHSCQLRNIDMSSMQGLAMGKKRWQMMWGVGLLVAWKPGQALNKVLGQAAEDPCQN